MESMSARPPRRVLFWLALLAACARAPVPPPAAVGQRGAPARGCDWAASLGRTVTVEGVAVDTKLGARLLLPCGEIGIADLPSWPPGFYRGGRQGQRVRVVGVVAIRADRPVFIRRPGEPERAGIPVPPGTDLDRARRRFVLEGARWSVADPGSELAPRRPAREGLDEATRVKE